MTALPVGGIKLPFQGGAFRIASIPINRHTATTPGAMTNKAHSQASSRPIAIEATHLHRDFRA